MLNPNTITIKLSKESLTKQFHQEGIKVWNTFIGGENPHKLLTDYLKDNFAETLANVLATAPKDATFEDKQTQTRKYAKLSLRANEFCPHKEDVEYLVNRLNQANPDKYDYMPEPIHTQKLTKAWVELMLKQASRFMVLISKGTEKKWIYFDKDTMPKEVDDVELRNKNYTGKEWTKQKYTWIVQCGIGQIA